MKTLQQGRSAWMARNRRWKILPYDGHELNTPPVAWCKGHAIIAEITDHCENTLGDPNATPQVKLLGQVELPKLRAAYADARTIECKFETTGDRNRYVTLNITFKKGDERLFTLQFRIQAWGGISKVSNN